LSGYLDVTCCPPVYGTVFDHAAIPTQLPPAVGVAEGEELVTETEAVVADVEALECVVDDDVLPGVELPPHALTEVHR
jgi:hypothetical protein